MHSQQSHFKLGEHESKRRHKKRHSPDNGLNRDEIVQCDYDKRSSGLKGRPCDVIWPEDGSPRSAVKTPTIIEYNDEGVSEMVPSFLIEFPDILLRVAKHEDRRAALQVANRYILRFKHSKAVHQERCRLQRCHY